MLPILLADHMGHVRTTPSATCCPLPAYAGQTLQPPRLGRLGLFGGGRRGGINQHRAGAVDVRQHRADENQLKTLGFGYD